MKIFFLGGSFDPPHLAHLEMARYCLGRCQKFLFIPAEQSPLKKNLPRSDGIERTRMLELMLNDQPDCEVDLFEFNSGEKNYTIHTISHLKLKYPDTEFTMLIGKDQIVNFKNWYKYKEILKQVNILCFNRISNDGDIPELEGNIEFVSKYNMTISSSTIREMIGERNPDVVECLHPDVWSFIQENRLYQC